MNVRNEASNQEVRFTEEGNYNEGNMEKKKNSKGRHITVVQGQYHDRDEFVPELNFEIALLFLFVCFWQGKESLTT